MNDTLRMVLSLSLSGGLLIAVLLLCRPLYRERLSKSWQYYIWLLVVARLLLPVAPEGNLMGQLFQPEEPVRVDRQVPAEIGEPAPADWTEVQDAADVNSIAVPEPEPVQPSLRVPPGVLLGLAWLGTALLLGARKVMIYRGFVRDRKSVV